MTKRVFWAVPMERAIVGECVVALMNVAQRAGELGFHRITINYARTDLARNNIAVAFLQLATDPDDTLVMLDNDHQHPADIIERLVAVDAPVVGALAFRRGEPYDPCFYAREPDGSLHAIVPDGPGLYECDAIGHAAIAIKRDVFDALGPQTFPWWRYEYEAGTTYMPSEDLWFCKALNAANVPIHCDASIVTPHLNIGWIDDKTWANYAASQPGIVRPIAEAVKDGE